MKHRNPRTRTFFSWHDFYFELRKPHLGCKCNLCSDFDLFIFKPLPEFRWGLDSAPTCLKIREPSDEDYWNGSQQYLIQFDKHYFRQFQIF